jgi:hypothetical protein
MSEHSQLVYEHRSALGITGQVNKIDDSWAKSNTKNVLRYLHYLHRCRDTITNDDGFEDSEAASKKHRGFTFVSMTHYTQRGFTLDSYRLYELIKYAGSEVAQYFEVKDRDDITFGVWHKVFPSIPIRKGYKFRGSVNTNGIQVCVTYWKDTGQRLIAFKNKPKDRVETAVEKKGRLAHNKHERERRSKIEKNNFLEGKEGLYYDGDILNSFESIDQMEESIEVIGGDPGIRTALYTDTNIAIGRKQYYHESGFNHVRRLRERAKRELTPEEQKQLASLSELSLKHHDPRVLAEQWKKRVPLLPLLWRFYGDKRWNRRKFSNKSKNTSYLDRMRNWIFHGTRDRANRGLTQKQLESRVTTSVNPGGRRRVLAFGNGRFPATRGNQSAPNIGIARHFARTEQVVMTDEFRTSSHCSKCGSEVQNCHGFDDRRISHSKYEHYVDLDNPFVVVIGKRKYAVCDVKGSKYHTKYIIKSFKTHEIHSLLECKNTLCGVRCDRDIFGSENIRAILCAKLVDGEAPELFRRKCNH